MLPSNRTTLALSTFLIGAFAASSLQSSTSHLFMHDDCEYTFEGVVLKHQESKSIYFSLNATEHVYIDTCSSDFSSVFQLLEQEPSTLEYETVLSSHRCSMDLDPSGTHAYSMDEYSIELQRGNYAVVIERADGSSSPKRGEYEVVITLNYGFCDTNFEGGLEMWELSMIGASSIICCFVWFYLIYHWFSQCFRNNGFYELHEDMLPSAGIIYETDTEDMIAIELDPVRAPMIGRWTATFWTGSARKGGDPDPLQDEKIAIVAAFPELHIHWPNGGLNEPAALTMVDSKHGYFMTSDGERIEVVYSESNDVLIVHFKYADPATISYAKEGSRKGSPVKRRRWNKN